MRIYLAGAESKIKAIEAEKPPYILFTFAACRGSETTKQKIMSLVNNEWCKDFLCDSGAFSYMGASVGKSVGINWDKYVDEYAEFVKANRIKHYFELDIDEVVGLKKVEEYRRRMEQRTGTQCIPVWHSNRRWGYFERMCSEYKYVAIGGVAKTPSGKQIEKIFPYFIEEAHKKGTEIHGLGYTDTKRLKINQFDSVDSTTWTTGSRYSVYFTYEGGAIKVNRAIANFPGKRIDGKRIDEINLRVWAQFARAMDYGTERKRNENV